MKIRIGALEIEVDTKEQLDELVMRYGGAAVAVVDSPASPPHLKSAMPGLAVGDLDRAIAFYTEKLGFCVSFKNGKVYAIVRRDTVEIGLALDRSERNTGHGSCYVKLKGVDAIHGELSAKGVAVTRDLRDESYGMREFMITDPDGNTINFGEPIP